MSNEHGGATPIEPTNPAASGHAAEEADASATDEETEPSVEEAEEDQVRARDQSAYVDPFTAIPIA
jgi:hypothetical protein